jgi:hypothetical protein
MNADEWQPSLIEKWALVSMVNYNCTPTVQLTEEEIAAKFNISLDTLRSVVGNYHRQVDEGVLVPDLAKSDRDLIPEKSMPKARKVGFLERIGGLWPNVRLSRRPSTEDSPFLVPEGVQYSGIHGKSKSENLLNQFYHFRIATASPYVSFTVAVFVFLSNIAYWTLVFRTFVAPSSIAICVVSILFSVVLFWILIYLRFALPLADQHGKYLFLMATMESCVALGIVTTIGCCLLMRSLRPCASKDAPFEDIWACAVGFYVHGMPADMAFILIFAPLMFSVIFPFLPLAIVYLSEMVAIAFVVFIMAYGNYYVSSTLITFLLLESMFYLYIFRDQEMGLFLHSIKNAENELMKQQAEQERKLAKRIANEMKIFISTISHDLKSVRKLSVLLITTFYFLLLLIFEIATFSVY